ncbi:thrombospondin type 3 repeat-containing protein [Patescibacteria group bacterium]|nr:thrombospondin type 3 repeat-containing protein [Patescibacteria group bacterium]
MEEKKEHNKKKRKIFQLFLFIVLGGFILFLGFVQLKTAIYGPYFLQKENNSNFSEEEILNILTQQAQEMDTDQDGLSDYEEFYTHQTSPYLGDSDGDNFNDLEEIEAESDPLDPFSTPYRQSPSETESTTGEKGLIWEASLPENLSAEEIRSLLLRLGIESEIVENISDKELENLYNETKEETGINPQVLLNPSLLDIDTESLRQSLIEEGIDPLLLEDMDDKTLKSMFLEYLNLK